MQQDVPVLKDLVLVGGGHSHVEVLRRFGMDPLPGVRVTLISRASDAPYSGMLPGLIAGHYEFDETHIDLGPLARFADARFYRGTVVGLDLDRGRVLCDDRPPVPYDLVSVNVGSAPNTADVPGAAEHAVPVKPISRFYERWQELRAWALEARGPVRIGVVGGGAGGVELALSVHHRLTEVLTAHGGDPGILRFRLITAGDEILETHNRRVRGMFRRILAERGIEVHVGDPVVRVEADRVRCASGAVFELDEILWVTAAAPAGWIRESGLQLDDAGFIAVDETLRSVSHPEVFAAGDIAAMIDHPRPKSGVFAVRQGPPLARNLRRTLLGRAPKRFAPQRRFLSLISTGDRYAVASRGIWALEGRWVWRWKDWIDRRFIRKYSDLPEMEVEEPDLPEGLADRAALEGISTVAMRCGGCGSKVGRSVLERALARIDGRAGRDVALGLESLDDAALLETGGEDQVVLTVDAFRALIDDPYVLGMIAANHSLGDIYAMGAEPRAALAIASLPFGLEEKMEADLVQMLTGASEVLEEADASLVGGHTGEGQELALGFAVSGLVRRDRVLRKGGLQAGQMLVLTKPVGTGTLFAADMRGEAKGRWIDGAIAAMIQPSRAAAQCMGRHGATAATDVTGFGLLGHLAEMVRASGVQVELDLAALPVLDGALETVRAGIFSSLQPQNLRLRRAIEEPERMAGDPRYALLFDPQTAGGLLAGLPAERAAACVAELRERGYHQATIIGTVVSDRPAETPIRLRVGASAVTRPASVT